LKLDIHQIDNLLADSNVSNRDALLTVKQELIRARDAVGENGGSIKLIRDNLETAFDRQIAEYQTLVLEYAQFVDDETLRDTISPSQRAFILNGLSPTDVQIADNTLGGRGKAIRQAAGLPNP
jgi:hypothetical protein